MCYNEKVKVNINSCGGGWSDEKITEGVLTVADSGEISLAYALDGDSCNLTVKDGKVTQTRRGEQCVNVTFIKGLSTQCTVGSGGLSGSYEVFTRKLEYVSGKGGFRLSLEYLSGSDKELIRLTLTAVRKSRGIK